MTDLQKWLDEQDTARDTVGYPRLAALAALRAVVKLHRDREGDVSDGSLVVNPYCAECEETWPCPTIRAIEKKVLCG